MIPKDPPQKNLENSLWSSFKTHRSQNSPDAWLGPCGRTITSNTTRGRVAGGGLDVTSFSGKGEVAGYECWLESYTVGDLYENMIHTEINTPKKNIYT